MAIDYIQIKIANQWQPFYRDLAVVEKNKETRDRRELKNIINLFSLLIYALYFFHIQLFNDLWTIVFTRCTLRSFSLR